MKKILKVKLGLRSYPIVVGNGIIRLLPGYLKDLKVGTDAFIITNSLIKAKFGPALRKALEGSGFSVSFKAVTDSERAKSIESAARVIKDLADFDRKKKVFIIALGGGVVGDLSGFVASLYKRGIPYIQIPTTLLAQVDSAIGGKTAVDLPEGKNLVGAFFQPRLVFSDCKFLSTLDRRQIASGLAEVIKYGLIKDKRFFKFLEKNYRGLISLRAKELQFIVLKSSAIKARLVGKDEREERGLRTVLNFGHTIGHAVEAAGGYHKYNHGEAVALGMLVEADLSRRLGLLSVAEVTRIERLVRLIGLPDKIAGISLAKILKAQLRDKKFKGARNRFVLLEGIGKAKVVEGVPLKEIKGALMRRICPS